MEVTISLAIVAIAALPMIGLISVALTSNRDSTDRVVVSQIVDQVAREVEQADYDELPKQFPISFFDEKGVRLENNDPRRIFVARARVVKGVELPVSGGMLSSPNLAKVVIDVAPNPAQQTPEDLFEESTSGELVNPQASRYSILVSRDD